MNGPSELERNITLGWEGFQGINTLAYWAHFVSYEGNEVL